ncbi:MAG: YkgJ family cysteine cluster protein [Minicystis sp.]
MGHLLHAADAASSDTETITVTLDAFGETVEEDVEVPAGKTTPRRLLPVFQSLAETMIERAVAHVAAEGKSISCERGCTACCHQLVAVSPMEARTLREIVEAMPEAEKAALLARFAAARARLVEGGLLGRLGDVSWDDDEDAYNALTIAYFALRIPCPFLGADGGCTIYDDRPLVCREHLVTTPAKSCANAAAGTVQAVPLSGQISRGLSNLEPARAGKRAPWTPLPLALEWARAHPEGVPARTGVQLMQDFFTAAAQREEKQSKKKGKSKRVDRGR